MIKQINNWSLGNALLIIIALFVSLFYANVHFIAFLPLISFLALIVITKSDWGKITFGIPNTITLIRLILIVAMLLIYKQDTLLLLGLAIPIAVLDGFDGYFARKLNQSTVMGATFDKECDAYYILALSYIIYQLGIAGSWVLLFGLLRYVHVLVFSFIKEKSQPELKFKIGQIIAVWVMVSLMAAIAFPAPYSIIILWIALGLLIFSFGRSSYYQLRR
jgi:phosphatidylglycerophosphate synthase